MARRDSDVRFGIEEGTVEKGFERLFRSGVAKPGIVSPHTDGVPLFDNDSIRRFLAETDQLSPQSFPGQNGPDDITSSMTQEGGIGDPLSSDDNLNGILTLNSRNASLEAQRLEIQRIALSGIDRNPALRAADVELGVLTMQQLALQPDDEFGQNQLGQKIQQAQQNRALAMGLAEEAANRDVAMKSFDLDKQITMNNARIANLTALQGDVNRNKIGIPAAQAKAIGLGYNVTTPQEAAIISAQMEPAQEAMWFSVSSNPEGVYNSWAEPARMTDADNYTEYVVGSAPVELQQQVREHIGRLDVATSAVGLAAQAQIQEEIKLNRGKGGQWEDEDFVKAQFLARRQSLFDQMVAKSFHDGAIATPPGALKSNQFDNQDEYMLARVIQDQMDPNAPNLETALNDVVANLPVHIDRDLAKGAIANLVKSHRINFNETNRYTGTLMDIQTTRSLAGNVIGRLDINAVDASAMERLKQNALAIPIPGQEDTFGLPPTRSTLGVPIPHPRSAARFGLDTLEGTAGGGAGGGGGGPLPGDVKSFISQFTAIPSGGSLEAIGTLPDDASRRAVGRIGTAAQETAGQLADKLGISPSAIREQEEREANERANKAPSRGIRG